MRKKIAVLRANALGDFIFVLPALEALRARYQDTEIVLLGKQMHYDLLANRPSPVDRVIIVPPYPGVGAPEDSSVDNELLDTFFEAMQDENFDMAIQLHGGGRNSNPFILRLGAKVTAGLKTPDAPSLDISIPYVTYFSEILRYIEVISFLGGQPGNITPRLTAINKDHEEAEKFIRRTGRQVAVMQPGASDPRRRWPVENFARVADALVEEDYDVYINGLENEKQLGESVIKLMRHPHYAFNLSGKLSLPALIGMLDKAAIIVSNDTGPLHLANALGRPTVGIYWAPNMITGTPMNLKLARPLIAWNTNCPLCGAGFYAMKKTKSSCDHNTSFVSEVGVDEVLEAIKDLLMVKHKVRELKCILKG